MFRLTVIAWLAAFAAGECEPGSAECKTDVEQDASIMKVSMLQKRSGATISQNTEELVKSLEARKAAILAELEDVEAELAAKDEREVAFESDQEAATEKAEFEETSLQFAEVANMAAENMTGRLGGPKFPCLCTYDVDRTLTGRQGKTNWPCNGNQVVQGVVDNKGYPPKRKTSYLTKSMGGLNLKTSDCGKCFQGIVSRGHAGGKGMQHTIKAMLPKPQGYTVNYYWSKWLDIKHKGGAPLIRMCEENHNAVKPECALRVMWWYNEFVLQCLNKDGSQKKGRSCLSPKDVYHFDDETSNIDAFHRATDPLQHKINAKQVGCGTLHKDNDTPYISLCGGTVNDFKNFKPGHTYCR